MGNASELTNSSASPAKPAAASAAPASAWKKIRGFIRGAVLWSYERGGWQYDLIVLLILAFIFLTPRAWFRDRPRLELSDVRHVQGIVEVSHGKGGWVYQVDARLVKSLEPEPANEAIEDLLRRRVQGPFTVKSIAPIENRSGVVLGYTVIVTRL